MKHIQEYVTYFIKICHYSRSYYFAKNNSYASCSKKLKLNERKGKKTKIYYLLLIRLSLGKDKQNVNIIGMLDVLSIKCLKKRKECKTHKFAD